jgi:CRP-like cAMP-binding protein
MDTQSKFGVLRQSEFFKKVPDQDLRTLAESMDVEVFHAGDTVFEINEIADTVFVVTSGELDVYVDADATAAPIRSMAAGDVIGEYALFTGEYRTATVKARTDCFLLSLENSRFLEFLELFPNITVALLNQTVHRLLTCEQRLREAEASEKG